ncbi:MAG: hypothetical protein JSW61_04780 [Candidatus Thorarchaeota archaeon]|nr:MAG: hypothetical protein JSW61_04780 [Candidatus Thorarchaeota archaeon]
MSKSERFSWFNANAARAVASVYGILVGLASIEHGIFEMLQGNVAPDGYFFDAIGDAYRFWPGAREYAVTIIPNLLLTGILAIVFGSLVAIWSARFVQRKYGSTIFLLLALTVFLVGGGFAPIFLTLLGVGAATRIGKPLNWWRSRLPAGARHALAEAWPWILIIFVFVFWGAVGIQVFGLPADAGTIGVLMAVLSIAMVTLMPLAVMSGLAYDAQKPLATDQAS